MRVLSLLLAVAISLAGCNRAAPAGDVRLRVALVVKTLNSPFFIDMQHGAEAAAKQLGVELVVQAAERELDVDRQMQIVENLIQTKIGAVVLAPSGSRELVPAVVKANAAGIPVIVVDSRLDAAAVAAAGAKTAAFVGSDNQRGGAIMGEHLVRVSGGQAKVAILEGIPGHETADSRIRGFREALKAAPGVQVVASQTASSEREQGFTVFQNMLQANPSIDAVFATNDLMALGAVEAIAAANRTGRIRVMGFDAIQDARTALQAGTMEASIAQDPAAMGRVAVETAVRVLKGETVPPEIMVDIALVTRDNARP